MKRTVIVFGGTFDPPHRAHTQLPPLIAEAVGAETILYVIAAVSPFKNETLPTSAQHRLAMLRLATADIPKSEICEIELSREGPSFTIDTLQVLRHRYAADVDLRLLIGADQAMAFNNWREWQQILKIAPPLIMLRPPHTMDALLEAISKFATPEELSIWRSWIVPLDLIDLSATELRDEHVRATLPPDSLVPEVRQYIDAHGLYVD